MNPRYLFLIANASWFFSFGMQSVVFAWLVTIVLREPAELVGWAQTAILLPGTLLMLFAGALADKVGADRQAIMAQSVAAVAPWFLIYVLSIGGLSYAVMIVYAVTMGLAQAFVTPARDGMLNQVAGGNVQRTVLQASLVQFTGQIIGYFIAGTADQIGAEFILILQSIFLLFGIIAYALIGRAGVLTRSSVQVSVWSGIVQGARTVADSRVMRVVILQNVAMACFFMGCFIVCFPLVVREVFDGSSSDLATLNAMNSLGLVVSILIMLRIGYIRYAGRALLIFQMIGAVALALAGAMERYELFVGMVFIWGICGGINLPLARTLMQELAPPEQRSRVMSFYAVSFMGLGPLGTVLNGYLAASFGPQLAIIICGSVMFVISVLITLFSSLWRTKLDPSEVPL